MTKADFESFISISNCSIHFEKRITVAGYDYLVIFGHHINGGFICIPNWQISCEACDHYNNIGYNTEKMISAGLDPHAAQAISNSIDTYLKEMAHESPKKHRRQKH